MKSLLNQSFDWDLMDAAGKVVRKGNLKRGQQHHFEIDFIDLPVGVYALRIKLEENKATIRKIIKQ